MSPLFSFKYIPKGRRISFCGLHFSLSLNSPLQRFFRPLISVIIPVYNVEKYLPQCLDSLLKQNFLPFEAVCVNDGSTDDSGKILNSYAAKDWRIHIINQSNRGLSAARNTGLKKARGRYILFVDSDDFLHPDALLSLYRQITLHNTDICLFGYFPYAGNNAKTAVLPAEYYKEDENSVFNYQKISEQIFDRVAVWNKLYRRELICKHNIGFPEGCVFEDIIFHIKTITSASGICLLNRAFYYYRTDNEKSITNLSVANTQIFDFVKAADMVYNYLHEKELWPSLSAHFCHFLLNHTNWHLKRATGKNKHQLAEKILSWINCHNDVYPAMDADPLLQSFYISLQEKSDKKN